MKFKWLVQLSLMITVLLCFSGNPATACPNCFSSASEKVLHTYYISAAFLSLLPFSVVALVSIWLYRQRRHFSHSKSEGEQPST